MTQEPNKPVNLSVHESSDPSLISPNPPQEASGDLSDLNDSVHDDENVDTPDLGLSSGDDSDPPTGSQISIANQSAG